MTGHGSTVGGVSTALLWVFAGLALPAQAADDAPKLVTLLGIPSAVVAPNHSAFVSLSYSTRSNVAGTFIEADDSSLGFGTVLGDAGTGVGLQFGASLIGLNSDYGTGIGVGKSGTLSFQAAHLLATPTPTFIAISVDHFTGWGVADGIDPAIAAIVTVFPTARFGDQSYPLMLTLGLGDHVRNGETDPGAFAGIGIGLTPNFGLSAAYTGETATFGTSFTADALPNWSFSAQLDDAFDQQDGRRVTLSATVLLENAFGG